MIILRNRNLIDFLIIFLVALLIGIPLLNSKLDVYFDDGNQHIARIYGTLESMKDTISIFEPIYNDGGDTIYLCDQISNKESDYDLDYKLALDKAMNKLKIRDKKILEERFIIGKTQMEIAQDLGISQAQISRIEKNAIKTLKKVIK